jgi:hypothetical protein
MMINAARRASKDPLYKNSVYIMLTSVVAAAYGFIFRIIAAKLYPKEDVGIAMALPYRPKKPDGSGRRPHKGCG